MSAGVSYTVLNCCHTCNEENKYLSSHISRENVEIFLQSHNDNNNNIVLTSSSISSGALSQEHALGSPQNSLKSL